MKSTRGSLLPDGLGVVLAEVDVGGVDGAFDGGEGGETGAFAVTDGSGCGGGTA